VTNKPEASCFVRLVRLVFVAGDGVGDHRRHASAARSIAEEHLASERVLGRLLSKLGVG
jgi:hypothetical protein